MQKTTKVKITQFETFLELGKIYKASFGLKRITGWAIRDKLILKQKIKAQIETFALRLKRKVSCDNMF
jgi:hypothetical protein